MPDKLNSIEWGLSSTSQNLEQLTGCWNVWGELSFLCFSVAQTGTAGWMMLGDPLCFSRTSWKWQIQLLSVCVCFVCFIFSVRIKTDVRMKTNRWRQMNPAQFSWSAGHCNTTPGAGRGRVLLQVQTCRWSYGRYFPEACWNRAFLPYCACL